MVVYSVVMSYLSVLRYESFTDAWDFGGFVQSIADATRGGFFLQTIDAYFAKGFPQTEVISFFGLHFSPILYLLVPIYAAFPYPPTLLIVQTVALALGALPVYWLAKKHLGVYAGVVFLVIYLTYAPLIGINLTDFHPEAFLVPSLLYAIYFGLEGRWVASLPFFALALGVIEESGVLVFGIVAFFFVYNKGWRKRRALVVYLAAAVGSLAYSAVTSQLTYYYGLDPTGFTLVLNSENYSILGATAALGVPLAIIRSPGSVFAALAYQLQYKLSFLVEMLAPVALLPVFYPEALLMALPWVSIAFLSNYPGYYEIYGFHQAFVIFFVFPAAILALKRIKLRTPRLTARGLRVYLSVMLIVAIAFSVVQTFPSSVYGNSFSPSKQNLVEDQIIALLPANASVLTTSDIFPHLANSLQVYTVPPSLLRAGYAAIDADILNHINPQYVLLNMGSGDGNIVSEADAILASKVFNGTYGLLAYSDKILLLKQGYTGSPVLYNNPEVYNASNLVFDTRYTTAEVNGTLYHARGTDWTNVWFGPYTFLPPGNYTATFTLRITSPVAAGLTVISLDVDYGNLVTITKQTLNGSSFPNTRWQTFVLNFQLTRPAFLVQFRGMYPTNQTGIALQSIDVVKDP
ncbi:MAG: DUF2079 domain-containing protein [Nitrososphaerota archaeon]|nr:DUF2079 domain-containing protein [Nitrososphaerota archaeon]